MTFKEFKKIIDNMFIIYKAIPLYTEAAAVLSDEPENYIVQHLIFSTYEKLLKEIYPDDYDKILTFIYNPKRYSVEELFNAVKEREIPITIVYNMM